MQYAATQVTFMHIKTRVDLIPPLLLLATSTPLRDIITRDSRDRLGFKVTGPVEVAALAPRRPKSLLGPVKLEVNAPPTVKLNSALLQLSTKGAHRSSHGSILYKIINLRCHLFQDVEEVTESSLCMFRQGIALI